MNPHTSVINSRPHKKLPLVWRRRQCDKCEYVFTTDETPRVAANKRVLGPTGASRAYNPGILLLSIAAAFQHNQKRGHEAAWELTHTVSAKLSIIDGALTTSAIKDVTYDTLLRFDGVAATQYALQHEIALTQSKRK